MLQEKVLRGVRTVVGGGGGGGGGVRVVPGGH